MWWQWSCIPRMICRIGFSLALLHWTGTHFVRVGCVLIPVVIGRKRLTWIPGDWHSCHARETSRLWVSGDRPQALALTEEVKFITWCQMHFFLVECRQGSKYFCNHQACLGYGPAPGSHNKKRPCALLARTRGTRQISGILHTRLSSRTGVIY